MEKGNIFLCWGRKTEKEKEENLFFCGGEKNGEGKGGKYLEKEINGDTDQLTNKANHSAICLCINVEFKCS